MATATRTRKTVGRSNAGTASAPVAAVNARTTPARTTTVAGTGSKLARTIARNFVKVYAKDELLADAWSKLSDGERDAILANAAMMIDREIGKIYPAT